MLRQISESWNEDMLDRGKIPDGLVIGKIHRNSKVAPVDFLTRFREALIFQRDRPGQRLRQNGTKVP